MYSTGRPLAVAKASTVHPRCWRALRMHFPSADGIEGKAPENFGPLWPDARSTGLSWPSRRTQDQQLAAIVVDPEGLFYFDTVEVWRSSRHGPTIKPFNPLAIRPGSQWLRESSMAV